MGVLYQVLATFVFSFLTGLTGFVLAWPSYTLANFISNSTVLSVPMSTLETSLLGSLPNIGALITTPFCGYILDKIGRKYTAMLFGMPYVLAWTVISLTSSVPLVLFSVFFAGVGCAGQAVSLVYISEISQDNIRGALTSSTVTVFLLSLLFSYTIGGHLTYQQVVYVHLSLSVLYIIAVSLLKESPVFLVKMGRDEEAAESIAFYRQIEVTSKEVELEITKIKLQLDPRIEAILQSDNDPEANKELIAKPAEKKTESVWQFLKRSESTRRALFTALTTMTLSILMGCVVVQVYAELLFKEAVPSMNSNQCSIYLALDLLVASSICSLTLDKFGRKFLMTSTSFLSGVFTLLLGTQLLYHWAPHWVTALLIYSYCFMYNLGAAMVPYVVSVEVFLPEVSQAESSATTRTIGPLILVSFTRVLFWIRGFGNGLTMACMWLMNFVTLFVFQPIVEAYGMGLIFCCFSIICFSSAAFCLFCLPETKGLSVTAIQALFLKKKKRGNPN